MKTGIAYVTSFIVILLMSTQQMTANTLRELEPTTATKEPTPFYEALAKALKKASTYTSWGSECVWIVDPEKRTAWTVAKEGVGEPNWRAPDGSFRIGDTTIGLQQLFAEVDRKLELTEHEED